MASFSKKAFYLSDILETQLCELNLLGIRMLRLRNRVFVAGHFANDLGKIGAQSFSGGAGEKSGKRFLVR